MKGSALPIVFDDVTVTAGALALLDRVSLTLAQGDPTVVVGPNGAGKTTLLRTAMGLIRPARGRITWNDEERSPPMRCAIMLQRPTMLRRTAVANVHFALRAARVPGAVREARACELLALVGLDHAAQRPARRLSGGEQHRLALARALARDPAVLFLDEPTASLDPASTKAIEDIIRSVSARGIKVVMSTHDLAEARRIAGEIVLLHRGRVVEMSDALSFFGTPRTEEARKFVAGELLV
jgi:tungstate transport system ATP-binding protein